MSYDLIELLSIGVFNTIILDEKRKIIIFGHPKIGSRFLTSFADENDLVYLYNSSSEFFDLESKLNPHGGRITSKQARILVENLKQDKDTKIYIFVRNAKDRFASGFIQAINSQRVFDLLSMNSLNLDILSIDYYLNKFIKNLDFEIEERIKLGSIFNFIVENYSDKLLEDVHIDSYHQNLFSFLKIIEKNKVFEKQNIKVNDISKMTNVLTKIYNYKRTNQIEKNSHGLNDYSIFYNLLNQSMETEYKFFGTYKNYKSKLNLFLHHIEYLIQVEQRYYDLILEEYGEKE